MQEVLIATVEGLEVLAHRVLEGVAQRPPEAGAAQTGAMVFALHGELGAGKTTFTQTLAKVLGVAEHVTSPTFVVMRIYPTGVSAPFSKLVHIDAYRIESLDELRVIGFEDLARDPENLICIEWAGRVEDVLPPDALHITFMQSDTPETAGARTATFGYKAGDSVTDEKQADQRRGKI